MNLVPDFSPQPIEDTAQLITFFVRERGLTEADLRLVVERQRAQELRFSEALLALHLATAADLVAAQRYELEAVIEKTGSPSPLLAYWSDPFSTDAEGIRALRTQLLLRQPDKRHNRLAVVSSNVGDGRSTLAASLAIACAQLEQPTLLIDADLRAPMQHTLFGLVRGQGLADTLSRGIAPRVSGVQGLSHLKVLTAGESVSNPLELLHSKPFFELLEGLRASYRHVVIDTAAATRGSDALATARAAGHAVTLARLHNSSLPAFSELLQRLRNAEVSVLGGTILKSPR